MRIRVKEDRSGNQVRTSIREMGGMGGMGEGWTWDRGGTDNRRLKWAKVCPGKGGRRKEEIGEEIESNRPGGKGESEIR